MKRLLLITFCLTSLFSYGQQAEPRSFKIGLEVGRNIALLENSVNINGYEGRNVSTFYTMLNQFGIHASLGSHHFPKIKYTIGLGYKTIETGYGLSKNYYTEGYTMPTMYAKPGLAFTIPLSERWKLIPSINAALNINLDKDKTPVEFGISYINEAYFISLNPALELQMNTDGAWYASLFVEYQHGFQPVITSYYLSQAGNENKFYTHNGSAINFGLKLSYCIPCGN